MSKLSKEELLEELDKAVGIKTVAYEQIKEMIQKPEVTEEWIRKKARELFERGILYRKDAENQAVIPLGWAKDFIRSLIEEINNGK